MDLSRNGLESLPVTGSLSHLKNRLTNAVDMTSPLGINISGSIFLDGTQRGVSIAQLADEDHIFSVSLLEIHEDDTFEGISLAIREYDDLSKTLRNQGYSLICKDKMLSVQGLNLSLNFHANEFVSISWYHPLAARSQI